MSPSVAFEPIFPLAAPRSGSAALAANHDCSAEKQLFWRRRQDRSFKLIVDAEWPADGRTGGRTDWRIDGHLMDVGSAETITLCRSLDPTLGSPHRPDHPVSPPRQIKQSFYLTEYNFTNWFVLAVSARSVYDDWQRPRCTIVSTTDRLISGWYSQPVRFKRRTLYHPLEQWDLGNSIENF